MEYFKACRTCGVRLGNRVYEVAGKLACRPCAVKADPARVAVDDKLYDARKIFDQTAAERAAVFFDKARPRAIYAADGSEVTAGEVAKMAALVGKIDPAKGDDVPAGKPAVATAASTAERPEVAVPAGLAKVVNGLAAMFRK
jgi:hypothetical protein